MRLQTIVYLRLSSNQLRPIQPSRYLLLLSVYLDNTPTATGEISIVTHSSHQSSSHSLLSSASYRLLSHNISHGSNLISAPCNGVSKIPYLTITVRSVEVFDFHSGKTFLKTSTIFFFYLVPIMRFIRCIHF